MELEDTIWKEWEVRTGLCLWNIDAEFMTDKSEKQDVFFTGAELLEGIGRNSQSVVTFQL